MHEILHIANLGRGQPVCIPMDASAFMVLNAAAQDKLGLLRRDKREMLCSGARAGNEWLQSMDGPLTGS